MSELKTEVAPQSMGQRVAGFFTAFSDLFALPAAFWIVIFVFVIESCAYFGVLTLLTNYVNHDLQFGDYYAGLTVSLFTGLVTLFMLGAGSYAEAFGLRRAILAALLLCLVGRAVFSWAPGHEALVMAWLAVGALLIVALGEAILQPVCYSGIKQYTNEKTSSMGYGLIYALMNAGIVLMGWISTKVRPGVQAILDSKGTSQPATGPAVLMPFAGFSASGVHAMIWLCTGVTALALIFFTLTFTRRREQQKTRPDSIEDLRKTDSRGWGERVWSYVSEGPFSNPRFIFFIFMLLPVRTLFAHQFLTLPDYVLRAYPPEVNKNMEWYTESMNPLIICFGVPIATALTRHINIYTMMIIGTLVSAAPTFMLCIGPHEKLLFWYIVLFSIGEALWSARFLEYASELAPEGRIAQYMGLASIPWLLAKSTTGLYSGAMLARYCPENAAPGALHTESLWFIYGCIAMASPIGLLLARRWVMKGLHPGTPAAVAQ